MKHIPTEGDPFQSDAVLLSAATTTKLYPVKLRFQSDAVLLSAATRRVDVGQRHRPEFQSDAVLLSAATGIENISIGEDGCFNPMRFC